jgi:hypothetical protein
MYLTAFAAQAAGPLAAAHGQVTNAQNASVARSARGPVF